MSRVLVPRESWEFDELAELWKIKDERARDVRRLILRGDLRPYAVVDWPLQSIAHADIESSRLMSGPVVKYRGRLWLATEHAEKIAELDAIYPLLRDTELPGPETRYWAWQEGALSLALVMSLFAVSEENRKEVESRLCPSNDAPDAKQEKTRDKMIVALYAECYGWTPGDEQCIGASDLVQAAAALGLTLSVPTIRDHLTAACRRAKPRVLPGRAPLAVV